MQEKVTNENVIDSLHTSLIDYSNIVLLAKFLAELSERKPEGLEQFTIDQLVVKLFAATGSRRECIARAIEEMIMVSGRAGHYAATNENGPALAKLKLMLSYIILHLTLEKCIRRDMQAQVQLLPPQTIDGKKLKTLREQLASDGIIITGGRLREYVHYGKILWEMVSLLGIIALPMIAVGGPAITTLCKKNGSTTNHFPVLASRLSTNLAWMALCKTWSPIIMEILFTNTFRSFTTQKLLNALIAQPIGPYTAGCLYQVYLHITNWVPSIHFMDRQLAISPSEPLRVRS